MKSFKEYLTESKKTYEFKVKLAGEFEDASESIKSALSQFKVETVSAAKRSPIQETQVDFPEHKNIAVTTFNITTAYPTNSLQVRSAISDKLGCSQECVRVRTPMEEAENDINHEHDEKSGESLLGKDYDSSNHQDVVGEKHVMSLLKELTKNRATSEQYTGVNDELLAKSTPSEKVSKTASAKSNTKSTLGSHTVKKPTAKTGKGA